MCARYGSTPHEKIERFYGARQLPNEFRLHYENIMYPSYSGLIIFGNPIEPVYTNAYWSLQYRFKKTSEVTSKYHTHNAMSETVDTKETYKHPWKDGYRCIISCKYFVEWRGNPGSKEALAIRPKNEEIFSIAGLYERVGKNSYSYTMLTCAPNEQMSEIHQRMPVILDDWKSWLDPKLKPEQAKELCRPYSGLLQASIIKP